MRLLLPLAALAAGLPLVAFAAGWALHKPANVQVVKRVQVVRALRATEQWPAGRLRRLLPPARLVTREEGREGQALMCSWHGPGSPGWTGTICTPAGEGPAA